MFFVIGLSGNDLANEIKRYDDIIIGDFEDTYENLALKTMLGYQFSIDHCLSGPGFSSSDFWLKDRKVEYHGQSVSMHRNLEKNSEPR